MGIGATRVLSWAEDVSTLPQTLCKSTQTVNGGRCNAKYLTSFNYETQLCDKKFTACEIEYVMKYTGKQGNCMKPTWFSTRDQNYWTKYAHLTRNGKKMSWSVWSGIRSMLGSIVLVTQ